MSIVRTSDSVRRDDVEIVLRLPHEPDFYVRESADVPNNSVLLPVERTKGSVQRRMVVRVFGGLSCWSAAAFRTRFLDGSGVCVYGFPPRLVFRPKLSSARL